MVKGNLSKDCYSACLNAFEFFLRTQPFKKISINPLQKFPAKIHQ
jgi:hypothetical protein